MATATIVCTFVENGHACMAVRVAGDASVPDVDPVTKALTYRSTAVEYVGRVPMDDAWRAMSKDERRAALVAAAKAARDAQRLPAPPSGDLPTVTGTVTV